MVNQRTHGRSFGTTVITQKSFRRPQPALLTVVHSESSHRSTRWSRPWENCKAPKHYVFLKKHKVASSTLRSVFKKIDRHLGLRTEPTLVGPQGGCYPARITKKCLVGGFEEIQSINYHFRWNMEEIDDLLEEGTIRVTSIREPLSCFRSVYNYFYTRMKKSNISCETPCWHYPFIDITQGVYNHSIAGFIDLLPERFDPTAARNFRVKNYQSFELGLDHLRQVFKVVLLNFRSCRGPTRGYSEQC